MIKLISKQRAYDAMGGHPLGFRLPGNEVEKVKVADWKYARAVIENIPTINAVPLEPLCKLLSEIIGSPCNHTDVCEKICGDACCADMEIKKQWKVFLTKWMDELDDNDWF